MNRKRIIKTAAIIVPGFILLIAILYLKTPQPGQITPAEIQNRNSIIEKANTPNAAQNPDLCDISKIDFSNRNINTSRFGMIALKDGHSIQTNQAGLPAWSFALSTNRRISSFDTDAVEIINIKANPSDKTKKTWNIVMGYVCVNKEIKNVLEQYSLSTPTLIEQYNNDLHLTLGSESVNSAVLTTSTNSFRWNSLNKTFTEIFTPDNSKGVCGSLDRTNQQNDFHGEIIPPTASSTSAIIFWLGDIPDQTESFIIYHSNNPNGPWSKLESTPNLWGASFENPGGSNPGPITVDNPSLNKTSYYRADALNKLNIILKQYTYLCLPPYSE